MNLIKYRRCEQSCRKFLTYEIIVKQTVESIMIGFLMNTVFEYCYSKQIKIKEIESVKRKGNLLQINNDKYQLFKVVIVIDDL